MAIVYGSQVRTNQGIFRQWAFDISPPLLYSPPFPIIISLPEPTELNFVRFSSVNNRIASRIWGGGPILYVVYWCEADGERHLLCHHSNAIWLKDAAGQLEIAFLLYWRTIVRAPRAKHARGYAWIILLFLFIHFFSSCSFTSVILVFVSSSSSVSRGLRVDGLIFSRAIIIVAVLKSAMRNHGIATGVEVTFPMSRITFASIENRNFFFFEGVIYVTLNLAVLLLSSGLFREKVFFKKIQYEYNNRNH